MVADVEVLEAVGFVFVAVLAFGQLLGDAFGVDVPAVGAQFVFRPGDGLGLPADVVLAPGLLDAGLGPLRFVSVAGDVALVARTAEWRPPADGHRSRTSSSNTRHIASWIASTASSASRSDSRTRSGSIARCE